MDTVSFWRSRRTTSEIPWPGPSVLRAFFRQATRFIPEDQLYPHFYTD
ncbi:MAG TPA: hypothetical protein VFR55_12055 [Dehalococcoidia bacterium]|nr:hypothetical protein [Dehalococcoidia bacterium]